MAKPALKVKQPETIVISTREDADEALKALRSLQADVVLQEQLADDQVAAIRDQLIIDTIGARADIAELEDALETWAGTDRKNWPGKHIELNFGTIGFRLPKPAIKLKLAVETILERLRAKKMHTCIRTVEEVDKEALASYDDDVLADIGCKRTKPKDKFYYELKQEEVK